MTKSKRNFHEILATFNEIITKLQGENEMELNREQVAKALECCVKSECNKCPLSDGRCANGEMGRLSLTIIKELTEENKKLEYTLLGVMHSVDKWLDGAELEMDEVNRAITMREKTLQIVEKLTDENEKLNKLLEHCEDDGEYWEGKYNNAVNDTIHRMQSMIKEECIAGGIYPAFVARVIENVGKKLLEGKNDV